jgi:deoxyribonucleoside regulator
LDDELKVKICRMYFLSDISKTDIAESLGISRFRVSRMIDQARQEGIVRIQIVEPISTSTEVEEQLEKRFGLHHAIVVHPTEPTDQAVMRAIGRAAAERLVSLLKDGDVLGITWGATVNEVVKALPGKVDIKLQVVQITGGLNQMAIDVNAMDLVRRVARVYEAESFVLHAPAMVRSAAARQALVSDNGVHATISMFEKVNVALSGIGAFSTRTVSNLLKAGYIDDADLKRLREKKSVGDVFAHFFDIGGRICDTELEQQIIGMGIEQLKHVRYSFGVAGGLHKSLAILGALRGHLINILVTDHETACDILEKDTLLPS